MARFFRDSRRPVVRRLLAVVPLAVLLVVTGTGATRIGNPADAPNAPAIQASAVVDPPDITDIENLPLPSFEYQFTGYVTDPGNNVGGLTITFSGAYGLPPGETSVQVSVTPLFGSTTHGTFTVTVQLQANTTNSNVTYDWSAIASDGKGRVSSEASCEITLFPQP